VSGKNQTPELIAVFWAVLSFARFREILRNLLRKTNRQTNRRQNPAKNAKYRQKTIQSRHFNLLSKQQRKDPAFGTTPPKVLSVV
jgi:hypothetical protein